MEGKNYITLVLARIFLDMTPKAKLDKWDYIKLKSYSNLNSMVLA